MRLSPRTLLAAVVCLLAAAGGGAGLYVWNQARRTLATAEQDVAAKSSYRFTSVPLARPIPKELTLFSAGPGFRDAALFQGRLYLAGLGGLREYETDGRPLRQFRVGLELPASPLLALAVGVTAERSEPELWAATSTEGLLAFDGQRFRHIRPETPAYRRLTSLLALPTGRLVVGTAESGVLVFDGRTLGPFHSQLSGLPVTALAGDDASLWVGTRDRGALHWRAGQITAVREADGLPDAHVLSVAGHADADYLGTPLGVAEVRNGRYTRTLAQGVLAQSLLLSGDRLLVGTLEQGIVEVSTTATRSPLRASPMASSVQRLLNLDGTPYALTNSALYSRPKGAWESVLAPEPEALSDANISALSVDTAGRLWVGYFDHGLDLLGPDHRRLVHVEDEQVFCVNRIAQNPDRALTAVATANGLVLFDQQGRKRQVLTRSDGLLANHVTDVVFRNDGMAIATPAGITETDSAGSRSFYAFHGLVNNHVYTLASSGPRLLAGTLGGLSVLESGAVRANFTTANSMLRQNWISAIAPLDGGWVIGTYGAGLYRIDKEGRWHSFDDIKNDFEVNPNAMISTPRAVYAGTLRRGLAVFRRDTGRWSLRSEGLPSVNVTALAQQGSALYIGTDNGLVRWNEGELL